MDYSQYKEQDFLLTFFKDVKNGFVVDIGAADGVKNSNSKKLIELGWSGLLVEPNFKNFKKLENLYLNNKKIFLESFGCSDESLNEIDFFIDKNDEFEQLSTFSSEQVEKCKKIYNCDFSVDKVRTIKTSELFEKYNLKKIDFITIDTESFDTKVVIGIDFTKVDIDLICVEHESSELNNKLFNNGFEICHRTLGNVFFKKKKQ